MTAALDAWQLIALVTLAAIFLAAVVVALYDLACDDVVNNVAAAFDLHVDEALAMVEEERP